MKRVTGLGGIFFKCKDPEQMKDWYHRHLGLGKGEYGAHFEWQKADGSGETGFTLWSPFSESTKYFEPSPKDYMINYRVENLEKLVELLREEGVVVLKEIEVHSYGKFVHIMDPEGNKVELWEPNDDEYQKLADGRTK